MARIVPSLVVRVIEAAYPWAAATLDGHRAFDGYLELDQAPNVSMILEMTERIPTELLPFDADDHATFMAASGMMRGALMSWSSGGGSNHAAKLGPSAVFKNRHPVVALLDVLRRSPDETAGIVSSGMEFIVDASAREDVRIDVANAHRALGNGEFKAATVLAGSVIEALLLWAVKQADAAALDAVVRSDENATLLLKRGAEHWHLSDYIRIARGLGSIDETAAKAATLAGEFRNLIHPGRVLRSGNRCDQGTALSALGAMHRIIGILANAAT